MSNNTEFKPIVITLDDALDAIGSFTVEVGDLFTPADIRFLITSTVKYITVNIIKVYLQGLNLTPSPHFIQYLDFEDKIDLNDQVLRLLLNNTAENKYNSASDNINEVMESIDSLAEYIGRFNCEKIGSIIKAIRTDVKDKIVTVDEVKLVSGVIVTIVSFKERV